MNIDPLLIRAHLYFYLDHESLDSSLYFSKKLNIDLYSFIESRCINTANLLRYLYDAIDFTIIHDIDDEKYNYFTIEINPNYNLIYQFDNYDLMNYTNLDAIDDITHTFTVIKINDDTYKIISSYATKYILKEEIINKNKFIEIVNNLKDFNLSKKRNELWKNMFGVDENINNDIPYKYNIFAYNIDVSSTKLLNNINKMLRELLFNIENNEKYQDDMIMYYLDINGDLEKIKKNIGNLLEKYKC